MPQTPPLLEIEDLVVEVPSAAGPLTIVDTVSLTLHRGRTLGLVGESGSGKSITANAVLGLIGSARIASGDIRLEGQSLRAMSERQMRDVRGNRIAMVFQEPMTALDPNYTVGEQIAETVRRHTGMNRRDAWARAVEVLDQVHIPSPQLRARDHPHKFSGGMRQRVVIAMAIACSPDVLLADEPTTALDVTTQAQVLALLQEIRESQGVTTLFISHDLGVIAQICDEVAVMYAGQVVEHAEAVELFANPRHPYTRALMDCVPNGPGDRLVDIPGTVPEFRALPHGCRFAARCSFATEECEAAPVPLTIESPGHGARCIFPERIDNAHSHQPA